MLHKQKSPVFVVNALKLSAQKHLSLGDDDADVIVMMIIKVIGVMMMMTVMMKIPHWIIYYDK